MSPLTEIAPGVHRWAVWQEDKQVDFAGHLLDVAGHKLVLDPISATPDVLDALETLGPPELIVILNKSHLRAAPAVRERFGCPLAAPALDAAAVEAAVDRRLSPGEEVVPGLRLIGLEDQKSPGESGLYWAERRLLAVGDALWGKPAGSVSLLPPAKYADMGRVKPGLAPLAELEVETLLVGDGQPILAGAGEVLRAFLSA